MAEPEVLDPEVQKENLPARLRHPGIPVSLHELAALRGEAIEIIEARIQILETARMRAIRMTSPEDWVLFKSPDERITGYLQDAGCDRIRDITGIEVFNVSTPERQPSQDGKSFMYLISGSGRSRLTLQVVEDIEGGRQSTDDFCKDKTGTALELAVRKAARANLDGNITRELAGLKTVPLEELQKAWEGTGKNWENCRKGRGFGTKEERSGGERADAPKLVPPNCEVCGKPGVFRTSARGGFYGCPEFRKHESQKWTVDLKEWEKDPRSKPQAAADTKPANGGKRDELQADGERKQEQADVRREVQRDRGGRDEPPLLTDDDIPFSGNPRGGRK